MKIIIAGSRDITDKKKIYNVLNYCTWMFDGRRPRGRGDRRLPLRKAGMARPVNRMRPVHPGEVLREEFLNPLGLSVNALAVALSVPATRIHEIVNGRRGITADTATRLARYFSTTPELWLNLQAVHDLKTLPTRMADYADFLIAIWDGRSTGTQNMIYEMAKRCKPHFVTFIK